MSDKKLCEEIFSKLTDITALLQNLDPDDDRLWDVDNDVDDLTLLVEEILSDIG